MSNIELIEPETVEAQAIAIQPQALPAAQQSGAVAARSRDDMLILAMDRGYSPEQIAQFMDLRDRHEAREAERAFNVAFAAFKMNPPRIVKDKRVSFVGQKGKTEYDHATHFAVVTAIADALAPHGLSHSFVPDQSNGTMRITCILSHVAGHSRSASMEAAYDASGGKNGIQAIASAKTYLERYTLLGITGLSTQDTPDDDGQGADAVGAAAEKILDTYLADLEKTATDEAAASLWATGSKALAAVSPEAYAEFKAMVVAHRNMLKQKGGAK